MTKQVFDKATEITEQYITKQDAIDYLINYSNASGVNVYDLRNDIVFKNETLINIDSIFKEAMKLNGEALPKEETFISIIKEFGFVKLNPYTWQSNDIVLSRQTKEGYYIIKLTKNGNELDRMNYINSFVFNDELKLIIKNSLQHSSNMI